MYLDVYAYAKGRTRSETKPDSVQKSYREAEERLDAMGIASTEAAELLKPAHELGTTEFWEHQDHGLAIFVSPTIFRYYQLPMEFQELVVVSDQFHLKPLLHLINNDGRFYILALSQDNVKFFEATRYSANEVEVPNMPKNLVDILTGLKPR